MCLRLFRCGPSNKVAPSSTFTTLSTVTQASSVPVQKEEEKKRSGYTDFTNTHSQANVDLTSPTNSESIPTTIGEKKQRAGRLSSVISAHVVSVDPVVPFVAPVESVAVIPPPAATKSKKFNFFPAEIANYKERELYEQKIITEALDNYISARIAIIDKDITKELQKDLDFTLTTLYRTIYINPSLAEKILDDFIENRAGKHTAESYQILRIELREKNIFMTSNEAERSYWLIK